MRLFITFLCLVLAGSNVVAQTAAGVKKWRGESDIGFYQSSGNAQASSLRGQLKLLYATGSWNHEGELEAINASSEDRRITENYAARLQSNYTLSDKYYVFGNGRYESNRFSGYEFQSSVASGLGLKLISSPRTLFSVEGGVGYRSSEETLTTITHNEAIYLGAARYHYQLSDTTRLESNWRVETGDESTYLAQNTFMEAVLALSVKMTDLMAVKLGYAVKHNTDVPEDIEATDTLTSVSLNLHF